MAAKRLLILRHAKSSWDDPGLDDHDRPLAPRGRKAAAAMAGYLHATGIQPALVLCSSARRAVETLEGVSPGGERLIEPDLYGASATELIERLRRVPDDIGSVMLIGHNPAMQTLVLRLAAGGDEAATERSPAAGREEQTTGRGRSATSPDLAEVQRKFPTAALATLAVECAWSELGPGCARLASFVRPKQLSRSSRT
jgi:phosphohistidine phosphatase